MWNPTVVQHTLPVTIAGSLCRTTYIPPTRQPTTATCHVAKYRNTTGINMASLSTIIGNDKCCQLQAPLSTLIRPRGRVRIDKAPAAGAERCTNSVHKGKSQTAKEYAWRCPLEGCCIRMQPYVVKRHSLSQYEGVVRYSGISARKRVENWIERNLYAYSRGMSKVFGHNRRNCRGIPGGL